MKCIRTYGRFSHLSSLSLSDSRLRLFLPFLSLSFALTSRAVCLRKGRQWARGSGAMCPRRSRVEYVGSLRSIACARSPTDVTPDPRVLNDRCHCALKRLLPLGLTCEVEEIHRDGPWRRRRRRRVALAWFTCPVSMGVLCPPSYITERKNPMACGH